MTDSTADAADFAGILAARALAEAADRQRNIRRTLAGVAVLLVHILAVAVFIYSSRIPIVVRLKETIPEAIFLLAPLQPKAPPRPVEAPPPPPDETFPMPEATAPITLPPIQHRPLAPPPSEGLLGVGRSLACGASIYENLSPAQREQCRRRPWDFVRRPDGTIVLQAPPKPVEPPPSGADVIRHEMQTAPPCPILANVPCLGKALHGDPGSDPLQRSQ
ncbi:MAG TPA: hypothetical protein VNU97_04405 [Rhizomicrobium sp.]|nr:hypothetical protein [Rhizomicrobium sp.]